MGDNYDEIERYAKGEMNEEDMKIFEQKMQADPELMEEANFYKNVAHTIQNKMNNQEIDALLDAIDPKAEAERFLSTFDKQFSSAVPKANVVDMTKRQASKRRNLYAIAAGFLAFVVAGSMIYANLNYSNAGLSTIGFQDVLTLNDRGTLKSVEVAKQNPLTEGIKAMDNQAYQSAIAHFQTIPKQSERYEAAQLYLAYAYLENGDQKTSLEIAEQLTDQDNDENVAYRAEWLAIQIMLQAGPIDATFEKRLQSFAQERGVHRAQALILQEQLQSFWRKLVL